MTFVASNSAPSPIRSQSPRKPTYDELKARIAELEAKQNARNTLTIKIMDVLADGSAGKGGVAVFGLQVRPVVLYAGQWERIFDGVEPPDGTFAHKLLMACKDPRASRK